MRIPVVLPWRAVWRPAAALTPAGTTTATATLTPWTAACRGLKQMPSRPPPPPEDDMEEIFVKGTGPGGQKINKTNSAVQLIHKPTGLVVKSQATRSRSQNRTIARRVLAAKLDELHNGDQSRTAIVADAKRRKKASASKKSHRKYRKLEDEKDREAAKQTAGERDMTDAQPRAPDSIQK